MPGGSRTGSLRVSLVLGMGEAARYALEVGMERGGLRARELARTLRGKLGGLNGIRVLDCGSELAAIVTIEVSGGDATELSKLLRHQGNQHLSFAARLRGD